MTDAEITTAVAALGRWFRSQNISSGDAIILCVRAATLMIADISESVDDARTGAELAAGAIKYDIVNVYHQQDKS